MNFIKKIVLLNKSLEALKDIKTIAAENSDVAEKIKEIIDDIINLLTKIRTVVPEVAEVIEELIALIKKYFKK